MTEAPSVSAEELDLLQSEVIRDLNLSNEPSDLEEQSRNRS